MKRIEPSEIPARFRAAGVTPIRGSFVGYAPREYECGCIVGLHALENKPSAVELNEVVYAATIEAWAALGGLNADYAQGLSDGWEALNTSEGSCYGCQNRDLYDEGWSDGWRAREECVAAGLI